MARLEEMMYREVETYLDGLGDHPDHPFVAGKPSRWRLTSWGTLIRDAGNLVPHIHLGGYMGGVYYPDLPDVVGRTDAGNAGWFELGRPPPEMSCHAEATVRAIQPEEGKMLLFPGYFYHRTIPFASRQRRISIAFDLVPEG